jgi:hypothetical protein
MTETPHALVKDLLSTGYFFEELKDYAGSKEIDLISFSRDFAVPYLSRKSESLERSGRSHRARILNLAVKFLYTADDTEMAETILALKRIASAEVDTNEKALLRNDSNDKSESILCRQKMEEALSLGKMLVSIIRSFKLAEAIPKRESPKGTSSSNPIEDAMKDYWEESVLPSV